jgi:hypothetical protein
MLGEKTERGRVRQPMMDAFERVLKLAKLSDRGYPDGTGETILANGAAIERVEKWIDRQRRARGWDEDAGREQTPSS